MSRLGYERRGARPGVCPRTPSRTTAWFPRRVTATCFSPLNCRAGPASRLLSWCKPGDHRRWEQVTAESGGERLVSRARSAEAATASRRGPLEGVRVVAWEQAVAGPLATRNLADLGADVIKIERPSGGDFTRSYDSSVQGSRSALRLAQSRQTKRGSGSPPPGRA